MQLGNAVDPMRPNESKVSHPYPPPVALIDQRDLAREFGVEQIVVFGRFEVACIDRVDDLQVPRQDALEQRDWPALQRLRQQSVIGIGNGCDSDPPRLVPWDVAKVDENSH